MTRYLLVALLLSITVLASCVVRTHPRHGPPPAEDPDRPPPPPPDPDNPPPPPPDPDRQPPPPPPEDPDRHRAPPAPDQAELTVALPRDHARRGEEIEVLVTPFQPNVTLYYNGRAMPKKVEGNVFKVTVSAEAVNGHFEVEWNGKRFRSPMLHVQ